MDCKKWRGPGKVIGHESQQVLIKHGGTYVRVHPCRVLLEKEDERQINANSPETEKCPVVDGGKRNEDEIYVSSDEETKTEKPDFPPEQNRVSKSKLD